MPKQEEEASPASSLFRALRGLLCRDLLNYDRGGKDSGQSSRKSEGLFLRKSRYNPTGSVTLTVVADSGTLHHVFQRSSGRASKASSRI